MGVSPSPTRTIIGATPDIQHVQGELFGVYATYLALVSMHQSEYIDIILLAKYSS